MLIKGIQLHHCQMSQPITASVFLQHPRAAYGPLLASWVLSGAYLLKLAMPAGQSEVMVVAEVAAALYLAAILNVAAAGF